jgi:hypothetical protein
MADAVNSETKSAMTLDELQQTPEYAACSDKMKLWLQTLISSDFNYKLATATAFNCKNLRQAHVFSFAVRKWPVVRAALRLYLGLSEQDVFLEDLAQTIRRAQKGSVAQVRAQALYARLKFGVSTPDSESEPIAASVAPSVRFHVGEIAILNGQQYRVTVVNPDGTVAEADPLP